MGYTLDDKLVVGISSSALFNLTESDAVFRQNGENAYRKYQAEHIDDTLKPGVAFSFIKRLLSLNNLCEDQCPLVEVIILSRNDPETGLRVMRSIKTHGLDISRAIFSQGKSPYEFMQALHMSLFLSANRDDVVEALGMGFAAGQVIGQPAADLEGTDLRVAFDFDGVLASDESERVFQEGGLEDFHENEALNASSPLEEGRLAIFLRALNRIQEIEDALKLKDLQYKQRLRVAIVTARNAPAHERVVSTLRERGLHVNDAFFLGGIDKSTILNVLRPHIFFDDQRGHLEPAADQVPCVHIPFGVLNASPSEQQTSSE